MSIPFLRVYMLVYPFIYRSTTTNVIGTRWLMNFAEILEPRFRYAFTEAICYISVRSIEYEYNRMYQAERPKPSGIIFTAWLEDEKSRGYPTIGSVYNFVMMNPRRQQLSSAESYERKKHLFATNITAKIVHMIHSDPSTNAIFLHPMLAVMFAISLNQNFAVEVIGHINGLRVVGCEATSTPIGNLWEAIDDRNLSIADYQKSLIECESLVNELRDNLRATNIENTKLQAENEQLTILLDEARSPKKSIMSHCVARVCACISRLCGSCRNSSKIHPDTTYDRTFCAIENSRPIR